MMAPRPMDEWDPDFREAYEIVFAQNEEALRRLADL